MVFMESVEYFGCFTGSDSVFFAAEIAYVLVASVKLDSRVPFPKSLTPTHASNPWCIVGMFTFVLMVFDVTNCPKVGPHVVTAIPIGMVNLIFRKLTSHEEECEPVRPISATAYRYHAIWFTRSGVKMDSASLWSFGCITSSADQPWKYPSFWAISQKFFQSLLCKHESNPDEWLMK